jgi:hypothetical protein
VEAIPGELEVRRAGTSRCPACGTGWPTRTSRFCGRCGAPMAPMAHREPSGRWRPLLGQTLVVLVLAAVVAAPAALALTGAGGLPTFLRSAHELDVEVPRGGRVQAGLQGDDARAALAPWDPHRLRCEPVGCERWRLDVDGGADEVLAFGDLLVVRTGDRFVALDATTGTHRWSLPVAVDDDPFGAQRRPPETHPSILASDDTRLVVGSGSSDLRLVAPDGTVRWRTSLAPPSWIWGAALTDELVVTIGPPPSPAEGGVLLRALDSSDGTDRWTAVVQELFDWSGGQLLVALEDGSMARLDPADGEVAVVYGPASWGNALGDELLLLWHHDDGAPSAVEVVRASDGTRLLRIEGNVDEHLVHDGTIVLQAHLPGPPAERTIIALREDGAVRWERSVPTTVVPTCCTMLAIDADERLHLVEQDGHHVALDLATGAELPGVPPREVAPHSWVDGDLTVTYHRDGEELLLSSPRGTARVPSGAGWLVHHDPPVVVGRDGLLGIELVGPPPSPTAPARSDGSGRARRTR